MKLREKQWLFSRLEVMLRQKAFLLGFEISMGEFYRTKEQARWNEANGKGVAESNHTKCLAVDYNLWRGAEYLVRTEDYRELGEWWEQQHPLCRWGGRFAKPDGGHFSLEHGGVA